MPRWVAPIRKTKPIATPITALKLIRCRAVSLSAQSSFTTAMETGGNFGSRNEPNGCASQITARCRARHADHRFAMVPGDGYVGVAAKLMLTRLAAFP